MLKIFFLLLLFPMQVFAQDLTGMWTGYLQLGDTKLPYELAISGKGNNLEGYSLLVFTFNGVENEGIKSIEIKMKKGSISVEDGELIYDNYTTPGRKVVLYGNLAWVGKDQNMTLAGGFATRSKDMRAPNENSFKGTVFLQRKNAASRSRLFSKLDEMGLTTKLSFAKPILKKEEVLATAPVVKKDPDRPLIAPRKTAVIRTIAFSADSIVLSLYDNGEIDGDTVSVLLNGEVILSKQGLTAKAITKTIHTSGLGDSSLLVLYAENLGRIPPNSGLMILQAGYERYQVRFSGDLENNSAVILKRRRQ